ncbi:phosphatidate cytidylyltransferase [Candidatus Accumulibacter sp. ACC003]|uniref:phosphatidate cytidylyltransferase n=1 Tax=Candidatus Accumulibacter sp. ACC003 TaxID=2823334 RepID=UPI0025C1062B|nr:phosphatidate cytidylyltransferase [Candidatus Accumulibacter sp. ACC003]
MSLNSNIWIAYGCIVAVLLAGTGVTGYLSRAFPRRDYSDLCLRVRTWWLIVPPLIVALSLGSAALATLFSLVSVLALREFIVLACDRPLPGLVAAAAYCAIPIQYLLAYGGNDHGHAAAFPLWCLVIVGVLVASANSIGFLRTAGVLCFGLLLTVFSLSYIARLGTLAEGTGLVIFLLMITQLNDVAQYVWGKLLGRTALAPTLSPNKTREGMLGGIITSALLGAALGPLLAHFDPLSGALSGILLASSGVAGDLTVSAIKRDSGVKDAGKLLPGHGGLLDRVDSLIYAAPLFFYGTRAWGGTL